MRQFTIEDLRAIIEECLGGEDTAAVTEATLHDRFDDLGFDSLALYEIVTRIQDGLHVTIPDEAVDRLRTPAEVLEYVNGRLAGV
ncbi:phosphopantetheine-binding protein [Micromonospora aurantiaca]|jgi:acyl carrier protein|uniref:phosphopantetheine-binding protein n=1 Tax=Micromonospora TaxID=1873 RepID=UPI00107590F1|nr:phosphopantetheine-binding protein [Micromonospora sp. BRA006-A]MDW3848652.1 phosphopantetheine-binding protein [Micromonospora sp. BRA006-A]MEE3921326.1 phosphopantetheine-binding protein [Micromonospora sp. BRA006-A]